MLAAGAEPLPPRLGVALCRGEGVLSRSRRLPQCWGTALKPCIVLREKTL